MKSISTLTKIHKKNLDEIAVEKNKEEEELQKMTDMLDYLVEESKEEIKKFCNGEYAYILESYLKEFRNKKEEIEGIINICSDRIAHLEARLYEEFSELKKFELIQTNRLSEQANKERKQETDQLDELNTGNYVREEILT